MYSKVRWEAPNLDQIANLEHKLKLLKSDLLSEQCAYNAFNKTPVADLPSAEPTVLTSEKEDGFAQQDLSKLAGCWEFTGSEQVFTPVGRDYPETPSGQTRKLTFPALAKLQLDEASAQYLLVSLAFQPSFSPPKNGTIISQWADHFTGGIPRSRSSLFTQEEMFGPIFSPTLISSKSSSPNDIFKKSIISVAQERFSSMNSSLTLSPAS